MPSIQESIHDDILAVCQACLVSLGYQVVTDPQGGGDGKAVVVYDEYAMIAWPPPPPEEGSLSLAPLTLLIQPGSEEERSAVTNADAWQQDMLLGLTISDVPETILAASGTDMTIEDWAKRVKVALIAALRVNRQRQTLADDTREFRAMAWTWGDGTGCGFSIGFKILWRTSYNDPNTAG